MNFTALKQELSDRGFTYLSDTRLGQYINWARAELDDDSLWPYRLNGIQGTNGSYFVDISDLGPIDNVTYSESGSFLYRRLELVDYDWLVERIGSFQLNLKGDPLYAYVDGATEIKCWPQPSSSAGFLLARYFTLTADLSAGTDTPLAPVRYHGLIVDLAVERAYRDSDNHAEAEQLRASITRQLEKMRENILIQGQRQYIHTTGPWGGY